MLSMESCNIHYLDGFIEFQGHTIKRPYNRIDHLRLCRRFLNDEDYTGILIGIFDKKHYNSLSKEHKKIVNCYFSFPG